MNISFGFGREGRGCSGGFPSLDVEGLAGKCQIAAAEAAVAEGSKDGEQESKTWRGDLRSARDTVPTEALGIGHHC